jgi:hypothetical protein
MADGALEQWFGLAFQLNLSFDSRQPSQGRHVPSRQMVRGKFITSRRRYSREVEQ